jgi:hypothetical protein
MATENITRTYRRGSETGLSGSEAIIVETGQNIAQTITLSSEEEVTVSFTVHLLQSIMLLCDQLSSVQVLETRFNILQTVSGPPGTITHTGDLEQEIFAGDLVRLEDMPTAGDNGVYLVVTVVEGAGTTTITLENGQDIPTAGGGAVGTVSRVASKQVIGYAYTIATAAVTGVITVAGDISDKFSDGDLAIISGSTGNDGIWPVTTVATDGPPVTTTTLTLNAGTLPDATNDGTIMLVRDSIELAANTPFLWSINSGVQNPFIGPAQAQGDAPLFNTSRGFVVALMVTNDATAAAAFQARLGTNSDIF